MSVTNLVFQEEYDQLCAIAEHRGWQLTKTGPLEFTLVLPARDGSRFSLRVNCDGYPGVPPTWNWCSPNLKTLNQPCDTPRGSGGYFHNSRRICAPWNRIAYREVDTKGPHDDWELANWIENPNTKACTTLSAMALRMFTELSSARYEGRHQ